MSRDEDATRVVPRGQKANPGDTGANPGDAPTHSEAFGLPVAIGDAPVQRAPLERLEPGALREPTRRILRKSDGSVELLDGPQVSLQAAANEAEGPALMGAELTGLDTQEPAFGTGPLPLQEEDPTSIDGAPPRVAVAGEAKSSSVRAPMVSLGRVKAAGIPPLPPAVQRIINTLDARLSWLPGWLGWVLATLFFVVVTLMVLLGGGGGVPEEELTAFFEHAHGGQYQDAEEVLESMDPSVALEGQLRTYLGDRRRAEGRRLVKQADRQFRNKNYQQALSDAQRAHALEPDPDALYLVAESLRYLDDAEAADAYGRFVQEFSDDKRVDDAMFWRAARLEKAGDKDAAKALYEQILAQPKSNFKRSAARRLKALE